MRKPICILLSLALLTAVALPAAAESRGGYPGHGGYYGHDHSGIGGFFAGLVGGAILGAVLSAPRVAYAPPPPAYVPPARVWVPEHVEIRYEREWFRDHYENVRVEVHVPGHWEEHG